MKKLFGLLIIISSMLLFAGCDAERQNYEDNIFIKDIDYLFNALYENWPFFEAFEGRYGHSLWDLHRDIREQIIDKINTDDMDLFSYIEILENNFMNVFGIGHLVIATNIQMFRHLRYNDLHTNTNAMQISSNIMQQEHVLATAELLGFPPSETITSGLLHRNALRTSLDPSYIIQTEIIEEGKIAYLAIHSFAVSAQDKISSFLEEIEGFDHLIIDVGNNHGGFFNNVLLLIEPYVDTRFSTYLFGFINTNGVHNENYVDIVFESYRRINLNSRMPHNTADIGNILDLGEIDGDYITRFDMGIREVRNINPTDYFPGFGGKVWVLTSNYSASAAEFYSYLAQKLDNHTVIGGTTRGAMRVSHFNKFALPYSGLVVGYDPFYVITNTGVHFARGVEPNIFAEDALQTTLNIMRGYGVVEIESIEYLQSIENGFVYFGRPTCSYCVEFEPLLRQAAEETQTRVYYFNTDVWRSNPYFQDVINQFSVEGVPYMVQISNGEIGASMGNLDIEDILTFVSN